MGNQILKILIGPFLIFLLVGCANQHCRVKKEGASMAELQKEQGLEKILVAKADGSRQCEAASGIPLDIMARDLGAIEIFRQFKQNDGMMRIQVCGAPTGVYNVYEISAANQEKALNVGFEIWKGTAQ